MTIYFGGVVSPMSASLSYYTASTNLDALGPGEFRAVFHNWLIQCWLPDERYPDGQDLTNFDLDALLPRFRREFVAGDWKKMRVGRGVTMEEYLLFLQLVNHQPLVAVLNREQPQQDSPRLRHKLMVSEYHIGSILIAHLASAGKDPKLYTPGALPVMLYDGKVGHVITARKINDSRNIITYDDPTWPRGSSMLCEGENAAGIRASHLGRPEVGEWMVNVIGLSRVIYCIPAHLDAAPDLMRIAKDADKKLQQHYRRTWGENPRSHPPPFWSAT
jgi:hypothetical protein